MRMENVHKNSRGVSTKVQVFLGMHWFYNDAHIGLSCSCITEEQFWRVQ